MQFPRVSAALTACKHIVTLSLNDSDPQLYHAALIREPTLLTINEITNHISPTGT